MKKWTKKKILEDLDDESSDIDVESTSNELSSNSEVDKHVERKKSAKKKSSAKEDTSKETKNDFQMLPKSNPVVQSNIEDLAEQFKRLELQLGEHGN